MSFVKEGLSKAFSVEQVQGDRYEIMKMEQTAFMKRRSEKIKGRLNAIEKVGIIMAIMLFLHYPHIVRKSVFYYLKQHFMLTSMLVITTT